MFTHLHSYGLSIQDDIVQKSVNSVMIWLVMSLSALITSQRWFPRRDDVQQNEKSANVPPNYALMVKRFPEKNRSTVGKQHSAAYGCCTK